MDNELSETLFAVDVRKYVDALCWLCTSLGMLDAFKRGLVHESTSAAKLYFLLSWPATLGVSCRLRQLRGINYMLAEALMICQASISKLASPAIDVFDWGGHSSDVPMSKYWWES